MALENQQKIEAEKQTVSKAKAELDKHKKMLDTIESKYSAERERMDQLSDEMEPLKVSESTAVSFVLLGTTG